MVLPQVRSKVSVPDKARAMDGNHHVIGLDREFLVGIAPFGWS